MAQIPLREYDVKKMFAKYTRTTYSGIQIRGISDIEILDTRKKYVIKPDMLFGKRGKRGMLGIHLGKEEVRTWFQDWYKKEVDIDGIHGMLDVFLVEEVVDITKEYYLAFEQTREGDTIYFSEDGGVDIEENWKTTKSIVISMSEELSEEQIKNLIQGASTHTISALTLNSLSFEGEGENMLKNCSPFLLQRRKDSDMRVGSKGEELQIFISSLFHFYRTHGFTSLEFNPIALDTSGNLHLIDAVAKVDDCEHFLQKNNWKDIEFPNNFGFRESESERYIRELDMQTGASLKLKILNPNAHIWTLFAGGGGSLVMTDSLGALGYGSEIGNYGELSGNPSREFTREYVRVLLREMLKARPKTGLEGDRSQKYLIIAGAIANFTDIATTFQGIIDILEELQDEIRRQDIKILVRRGGINEQKGLTLLRKACKKLHIKADISGSESYMTDILEKIKL